MGILDLFSPKPAADTTPAAAPNTPASTAPAPGSTDTASAVTTDAAKAPLDAFTKLWETDAKSGDDAEQSLFAGFEPQKVFEAASKSNFASAITPEMQAAILAGGEGAQKALTQAINAATQAAFAQSTIMSTKLIEQAINKTNAKNLAELPNLVKRHAAADSLQTENPALSNPAAAPIINALQAQLAVKHPDATASQLKAMATDYLGNFAELVKPTKPAEDKTVDTSTDWSKFLTP